MLKFGSANAKLKSLEKITGKLYTFSLLSGYSCPYAKLCLSKAVRENGKTHIEDGKHTEFRCFSASSEALFPAVYSQHEYNYNSLKNLSQQEMTGLIGQSIPLDAKCIRLHVAGDFFNQDYFDSWLNVIRQFPSVLFYAYTKSLPFWIDAKQRKAIPSNLSLTASRGGFRDSLIRRYKLRQAVVIADPKTCQAVINSGQSDVIPSGRYRGWSIDHNDKHAALPEFRNQSFGLLIHSIQPGNTPASKSLSILNGIGSYSRSKSIV